MSFGYEPDQPVLKDIDLTITPGETVALVGATGAGKSTLISLLVRFYDPVQGAVRIDGQDVRRCPPETCGSGSALSCRIFSSCRIRCGPTSSLTRKRTRSGSAAPPTRTGLEAFIDRLPQGLDTRIGEGALNLSLGEKQLLSFVRALYRDPAILVLDEATASIDTESENMLEQAIEAGFQRPYLAGDRPSALHYPPGGPDCGHGSGAYCRAGKPRGTDGARIPLSQSLVQMDLRYKG